MRDPQLATFTIPYPPSVNRYWRNWRGRMVLSKQGRQYKEAVAKTVSRYKPMDGPVYVHLHVFRPRKRGDLDNTLKGILDSLTGYLYHDDSQVVKILAVRGDDKQNPRVEVTIGKQVG